MLYVFIFIYLYNTYRFPMMKVVFQNLDASLKLHTRPCANGYYFACHKVPVFCGFEMVSEFKDV